MLNYPRIFERVYLSPLCVTSARFASIHAFLLPRLTGKAPLEIHVDNSTRHVAGSPSPAPPTKSPYSGKRRQKAAPLTDEWGRIIDPRFYTECAPGVAQVPVYGALAKNLSAFEESCGGGTDINAIQEALRQAAAAPDIRAIIMDFDSPGGEVTGIPEFGNQIRAAAAAKPVYAFTDAMMASAAYWLGSQCTEVYVTPDSSSIGSIGTYLAWLDESVRMKMEGLELVLFAEGKHKGMGLPGRPLSADDEAYLRDRVKTINDKFKGAVTSMRPEVDEDDGTMEGQTFIGAQAVERGLADGVVNDFEELLELV